MEPLQRAIEKCGLSGLATACQVSPQAVHKWKTNGVPAERVLAVEEASGISRYELRPDIYGTPEVRA